MNTTRQLPASFGPLKSANANARITGPCGDTMEFWLLIDTGHILRATFTTDGCGASIACGAMTASMAEGKTIEEAARLTPQQVEEAIGGLPEDHKHCPVLALKTLRAALGQQVSNPSAEASAPAPGAVPRTPQKADETLRRRLSRIAFKLLVLSGKGGVGKSTVAVNLAVALAAAGKRVGLLDVDVHGPSIPTLLGLEGRLPEFDGEMLQPVEFRPGLKVMSLGLFLKSGRDAVIWRGPMKYKAIEEMLGGVEWGDLDVLVVDAPPGTGDEPLAVAQLAGRPAGAVVVTTPQQLAITDVRRCIAFCEQVRLPILGVVENMSGFSCPQCGHATALFKTGGGEELAVEMSVPFLGRIPLLTDIVTSGDSGQPFAAQSLASPQIKAFAEIVRAILAGVAPRVSASQTQQTSQKPTMKIAIPLADGHLSDHFGHCEQFALIETDPATKTVLGQTFITPPPHEPQVLPRWLHEQGVHIIIAGGMGQMAKQLFAQNGIHVVVGAPREKPQELAMRYLEQRLTTGDNACDNTSASCGHSHTAKPGGCHGNQ
ncbi:MAG: iron-sulfur cluster carrier protein MrpORP [Verrucomicrobiia bacterium]